MPNLTYSKLAEIELREEWLQDPKLENWLKSNATFEHKDSYEFIHHLYQEEDESWFITQCMSADINPELKNLILESRRSGSERVCFFT